jgi:sugar (pentulose or hexulose) kinase
MPAINGANDRRLNLMSSEFYLGIDLGTTVLKVGVFSGRDGRCAAQATRRLPVTHPEGGGQELAQGAIEKAFRAVMGELRIKLGTRWGHIAGMGVAAQGGSSLIVERETGVERTPMVLWNDARASEWTARLAQETDRRFWNRLFLFDMPPAGLGRLCWLRERVPNLFSGAFLHIGAGEWLFHRLTGVWRQDSGNAIQVGSYNARTRKLDATAFEMIGLPLSFVAPLRQGHETAPLGERAARSFHLPAGMPVAGPYIDQEACFMAATAACLRPLQCSLGTAWVGNFLLPTRASGGSPTQIVLSAPDGTGRLVVQPLMTGNTAWDWALRTFVNEDLATAIKSAPRIFAHGILPPQGLAAVPWCGQQNPLEPSAYGAGVFVGMNTQTTRGDLLRAVAAGMVFELKRMFEHVCASGMVDGLVLGGGASRGAWFRALTAALFHPLSVQWQRDYDLAAARGAVSPLSRNASRGLFVQVSPGDIGHEELQKAQETYAAAFFHMYGACHDARPFRCRAQRT